MFRLPIRELERGRDNLRTLISAWRLLITLGVVLAVIALISFAIENNMMERKLRLADKNAEAMMSTLRSSNQEADAQIAELERQLNVLLRDTESVHRTQNELAMFRSEMDDRLTSAGLKISKLEASSHAIKDVIAKSKESVILLQISFRLLDNETQKPVRHYVVEPRQIPVVLPDGSPFVGVDGNGPIFEPVITGTGFVVSEQGLIVTNRHVARPWEQVSFASLLKYSKATPQLVRLSGFAPGLSEPIVLTVGSLSEKQDLALLSFDNSNAKIRPLQLDDDAVDPGEDVVVLGYPTGIRALLARAGSSYLESATSVENSDLWSITSKLARDNMIHPLASGGIVAQRTDVALVYDAETTGGGSGGPVLTANGRVAAVNSAVFPEFGGSNIGIPVSYVIELIEEMESAADPSGT